MFQIAGSELTQFDRLAVSRTISFDGMPDGDPISYRIVNNPTRGFGQLVITSDGRAIFRYRASGAFNASDRATFIVTDSAGRQSSAATISVNAVASASGALQVAPSGGDETPSGGSS